MMYKRHCILALTQSARVQAAQYMRLDTMSRTTTVVHKSNLAKNARATRQVRRVAHSPLHARLWRLPEASYGMLVPCVTYECEDENHPGETSSANVWKLLACRRFSGAETIGGSDDANTVC